MQSLQSKELGIFNTTFAHAAIGVAITDFSGRFVHINDAYSRITGYSQAELYARDFLSITHADYRGSNEELFQQLVAGHLPAFVFEKPYIKKSGDLVWVQNSVSLLRDQKGNPINIITLCEDITQRKITQNALLESEERFRLQFRATPVPIFSWRRVGHDFVLVDYNDSADRMTNHGIAKLVGRKASELYGSTPEVIEGLEYSFRQKKTVRRAGDFRLLSTGEPKHLDVSFVFVPPDLVMINTEDITERRQAEEARLVAERKYRDIFENANEGVFQTTPDGRFLAANPALARILGFDSPDQLINERTNIASQHYVDSRRREEFRQLLDNYGTVRGFEYEAYRKDGSRIWMSDSVRTVRNQEGKVLYYEGIAEDITERKHAENDLRKQKEILQKIFEHIPVMVSFVDESGRIELINQEGERTLGWTLSEIFEGNVDVFAECYPDQQYRADVMEFVAKSRGEWREFRTRVKDGRVIDTSWSRVKLSDGRHIVIGKDITQLKRAALLSAASAALAHGLSGARSPREAAQMIAKTADELFGWEAYSLDLYDSAKDAIQPTLYIDTIGGERRDVTPIAIDHPPTPRTRRAIERGPELIVRDAPTPSSTDLPFGNTKLLPATIMSVPIRYAGKMVGVLSIKRFNTEFYTEASLDDLQSLANLCGEALNRIRTEQSLYESEERFRQFAENIDAVIWMVDLGVRNLLYINPAYEKVWGQSIQSRYDDASAFLNAIHPDDRQKAGLMIEQQMNGNYGAFEYRIIRPDGSVRWIRDHSFPIRNADGQAYRVAGVAEDITERKRAEMELRNYSRRLIEVQESERKHIARELHDEIGQVLTAVRINLQSIELSQPSSIENQIAEDIRVIDEALKRVRDLSFELRPSLLDDLGLAAATSWYVERYTKRAGMTAEVQIDSEISEARLPREVETACFRILQEALANVARHAQAEHVWITLRSLDCVLLLSVKDDGIGMEASSALQNGDSRSNTLGLRGMEERALAVAGRLEILSAVSGGTEIRALLPCNANRQTDAEGVAYN